MKNKLTFALFLLWAASSSAAVVEVVNATDAALRFTSASGAADNWVPQNGSRRWTVPEDPEAVGGIVETYTVSALVSGAATSLGTLAVSSNTVYLVGYDGVAGLSANARSYDASVVYQAGGYTSSDIVRWTRYGCFVQFTVEIAGLCFFVIRYSKQSWSSFLWGDSAK